LHLTFFVKKKKHLFSKGGERTKDEMCLHMFTYYPRMNNLYSCMTLHTAKTFETVLNLTEFVSMFY